MDPSNRLVQSPLTKRMSLLSTISVSLSVVCMFGRYGLFKKFAYVTLPNSPHLRPRFILKWC